MRTITFRDPPRSSVRVVRCSVESRTGKARVSIQAYRPRYGLKHLPTGAASSHLFVCRGNPSNLNNQLSSPTLPFTSKNRSQRVPVGTDLKNLERVFRRSQRCRKLESTGSFRSCRRYQYRPVSLSFAFRESQPNLSTARQYHSREVFLKAPTPNRSLS